MYGEKLNHHFVNFYVTDPFTDYGDDEDGDDELLLWYAWQTKGI